mgnify:CR=1 FL=1
MAPNRVEQLANDPRYREHFRQTLRGGELKRPSIEEQLVTLAPRARVKLSTVSRAERRRLTGVNTRGRIKA